MNNLRYLSDTPCYFCCMTNLVNHDVARASEQTDADPGEGRRFEDDIINSLPGIYYLFDERGKMLRWSENLERITGRTETEIAAMSSLEFFEPEQQADVASAIQSAFLTGEASIEAGLVAKGGQVTPYLLSARRVVTEDRVYLVGTGTDLSERKETETALAESEQKFRQLAEHIDAVFWVSDLDKGEMAYISPAYETIWGRTLESLYETPTSFVQAIHPEDRARVVAAFALQVRGEYDETYRVVRPDGSTRWVRDRAFPIRDERGAPYRIVGFVEDITERQQMMDSLAELNRELEARVATRTAELARANEQLQHDAYHDALTGLPNRKRFMERLAHAVERTQQGGAAYAVLFLDLDDFKVVNDSLGHAAGDALLREVGRRLEACLRPGDTVARLGGDEFAMLLENVTDEVHACQIATRIAHTFTSFTLEGHTLRVTPSIGVTLSELESYSEVEALLRDADIAMYGAKAQGKGCYALFAPAMRERAKSRLILEAELRTALAQGELCVHYQPIVAAHSGELVGLEALVRWQHPERGTVSPADFIPLAEETKLITELDRYVLREACAQVGRWQRAFRRPLTLSVNLSGQQFTRPDLACYVRSILQDTGFDAQRLHLELTESLLIEGSEQVAEALTTLRALGVKLHLDDFGTGYSSLSYLQRFSAHTIKIDRSFIRNLTESQESATLVRTIILMADALGMQVVAEGVETEAQLDYLKALGCDYLQGYLFGKPLNVEEAAAYIAQGLGQAVTAA